MIYLIRHGQTDWNAEGKNQGHTDIELNKNGVMQASELATQFKNINLDIVFSSPLKRASKTAEIIYNDKIIYDCRIMERCNGELEGQKNTNTLIDFYDPNDLRYNVEPLLLFRKRINDFWDDVKKYYSGKDILVVTHAGVATYSQAYFYGEPKDGNYLNYKLGNGNVLYFENKI